MVIIMLMISMTACSSKKDEEVKGVEAENEMDPEKETDKITSSLASMEKESLEGQSNQLDTCVYSLDRVYEFIKSQYPQYTKDDFNKWNIDYFDITGNNIDEVIITSDYYDGNLQCAIILTKEENYREISRYIPLAKYGNNMKMQDGFLVHTLKAGGPGAFQYYMDLYIYGGYSLEVVWQGILLKEKVVFPWIEYELIGEIEGSLKDFLITYTLIDFKTNEEKIIAKNKYNYYDYGMDKTPVSLSNTAKSFDSIYNGNNLLDTVRYFYENLYMFGETERVDFAKKMFEVIIEDRNSFTEWGEFIHLPIEHFNKETMQYDIRNLDEFTKEKLIKLKDSDMYSLVRKFFSTEGSMDDGIFDIMMEEKIYQMLKPAYELLHKEGIYHRFPILKPDIYYTSHMPVAKVTKTHIVYPNVLVNFLEDVKALEGQDTWKTNVLLRVEIIQE